MNAALIWAVNSTVNLASEVSVLAQDKPVDEDTNIVAGWLGFAVFAGLILAVAVIGFALSRSLKTAQRAKDTGVFGDPPAGSEDQSDQSADAGDSPSAAGGDSASSGD